MKISKCLSLEVQQKKVVLMLDNEPLMIDRRIILEAQTLVNAGYRVVLATRGDSIKPDIAEERGIEIYRFPSRNSSNSLNNFELARQKITDWKAFPSNLKLERRIRTKFARFPRLLQSFIFAIYHPPVFAASISSRLPLLRIIFGRAVEPLCYLLLCRGEYIKPYIIILGHLARKYFRFSLSSETSFDLFERQILEFAINELKPDFVHAHDLPNLQLGIEIARQNLIPLIYDAHELYPYQYFSNDHRKAELANLERRLAPNADAIIVVNKQCEKIIRSAYSNLPEVVILSNATEMPASFNPKKREKLWHRQFDLHPDVKIMVFQGGINYVRNIDSLVHALVKLPENLHIGFITFKKDIPYYKVLSSKLGISHRIHYVLEIPWDHVIHWLAAADVGVMPYQPTNLNAQISSPNKLFEFIIAGLPIIGSSELVNVKNAIETYKLGVCHLLRENDSYVDAINLMFSAEEGGPERFRDNVLSVRHLFSWDNESPRLLDLYSRLAQKAE